MPKGDLDDTREWDEPNEGLQTNAKASNWFEGTSRDLLFYAEKARAESVDVVKASADVSTDAPLNKRTVANLDAPRSDGRDDARHDLPLDNSGTSVAQETGTELARSIAQDRSERAPLQERSAMREETCETISAQLDRDVPAPVAESTMARSEIGDSRANLVDDNSEQLASLRDTVNPLLIAAQQELMQEVVDNAAYKAKFLTGAAAQAGVHAAELTSPAVDLLHRDWAGVADGLTSTPEHVSGLIEAAKMFRDGLEFPVVPDEVRQREQAISEWWNTLNPPPDKPRP